MAVQTPSDQHIRQFQHALLNTVFKSLDSLCSQGNDTLTPEPGHTEDDQAFFFFLPSVIIGSELKVEFENA